MLEIGSSPVAFSRQAVGQFMSRQCGGQAHRSGMRVIPANVAPLRLLASYVGAIANMAASMSTEMSGVIAAHLHDLVALSLGPTRDAVAAAAGSLRSARLQAIKRDIAARLLEDPDLTVAAIAARHQVTAR